MAKKIEKKELNEPDRLQLLFLEARTFVATHRKRIYAGAGGLVLILLLISGWHLYGLHYEKNAGKVYSKIFENARKAGSAPGDQEEAAIKGYRELIAQYPRSQAAVIARYRLGGLHLDRRQFDEAIAAYRDFLDASPAGSDLVPLAHNALGVCHEAKQDFQSALQSFENAMKKDTSSSFEALNYTSMARIYEAMKDTEKAVEFYKKALGKTSDPLTTLYLKRKASLL
ncbi:MAG: tetratricopeptide repeat protein [Thermodesulfobacteriota bacterium]